jgi:hypothetical protein
MMFTTFGDSPFATTSISGARLSSFAFTSERFSNTFNEHSYGHDAETNDPLTAFPKATLQHQPSGNSFAMAKPSPDDSDKQLQEGLASGTLEGRDALIAEEILKRRHEERAQSGGYKFGWLGAAIAAFWLWAKLRLRRRN